MFFGKGDLFILGGLYFVNSSRRKNKEIFQNFIFFENYPKLNKKTSSGLRESQKSNFKCFPADFERKSKFEIKVLKVCSKSRKC